MLRLRRKRCCGWGREGEIVSEVEVVIVSEAAVEIVGEVE